MTGGSEMINQDQLRSNTTDMVPDSSWSRLVGQPALRGEELVAAMRTYAAASQALDGWIAGAQAVALLRVVLEAGVLDAARVPRSSEQIASATGLTPERADDLCTALEAHGVFDRNEQTYRLSADFSVLLSADAPQSLRDMLNGVTVKMRALEGSVAGVDYTSMSSEDMLAMALGIGTSALSPLRSGIAMLLDRALPEVAEQWRAGGRHLEVGCGVGNNLLAIAAAYPAVTAVGVEIDPAIAEEAHQRAVTLGVADRVEVRCQDARQLDEDEVFHTAQWSQAFFPADSRSSVLATVLRALVPGGYLLLPLLAKVPEETEGRRTLEGRTAAVHQLLFRSWGVPVLGEAELREEVEATGFTAQRTVAIPPGARTVSRSVLLARRSMT